MSPDKDWLIWFAWRGATPMMVQMTVEVCDDSCNSLDLSIGSVTFPHDFVRMKWISVESARECWDILIRDGYTVSTSCTPLQKVS